ncbi:MAG: hypothetical protein B0D92_01935 [Spirochaeta sp. LUC14_002_19_P3]|nr:MAG: hypothetical protein B0D92_01935 [Spirochaeta sp. LUC14_002_19_P3]
MLLKNFKYNREDTSNVMIELDPSLKNLLIETISGNMPSDQIEALGQMLIPSFSIYELSGKGKNFTIAPKTAAELLVNIMIEKKHLESFIKLLVELDEETIGGKEIHIQGLEYFLQNLANIGYIYDPVKRKVIPLKKDIKQSPSWGVLKNKRTYHFAVLSIDIVGSSELVREFGREKMEKFYAFFGSVMRERLTAYDGRIWSWAGDGGIVAFTFKQPELNAVQFSIEMQRIVLLVNTNARNPISRDVAIRIGVNAGDIVFLMDTGRMVSDVINLAAHLEKGGANPGMISITGKVWKELPSKMQDVFSPEDDFEGQSHYRTPARLDQF